MRKITDGELRKILEEHERWRDTDEKEGKRADLSDAILSGADLSNAKLSNAKLLCANMGNTNLRGANLAQALLSIHILSSVETLYEAELDPELMEQVKDKYPHLLEKPEYYEEEEEEEDEE